MNNDIHKYKLLVERIILDESFKDAKVKFSEVGDEKEINSYIDLFKELTKRNKIQGAEKDISYWIRNGWESFKAFVDSKRDTKSKREVNTINKKDSIVVYKDDTKQVVIPLTKEASIQYGKNTKWCTSAIESKNYFINYFHINKITLFYVLFSNGDKYACAFHPDKPDTIECFDQQDKSISFEKFEEATGITKKDIQNWYNSNKTKIEDRRDLNKCSEEVQLAAVNKDGSAIEHISSPSEKVQLAAVNQDGLTIKYISNPSEKVQLAAVNQDGLTIKYISNPSEEVQLAAVNKYGDIIHYIIKKGITPSEEVQLAAVNQDGYAIRHISNPSEKVQLAAVTLNGSAIELIDKPSETVQLAAVSENGFAIRHIIKKGIVPSEEVQLAAVSQDGYAIRHISNPSEEVQLDAVSQDGSAIRHIDNPSEQVQLAAVSENGRAIRSIDNPSEAVQLAAVQQYSRAIEDIIKKGIEPSEAVRQMSSAP